MNEVTKQPYHRNRSVIAAMAERFAMTPENFEATLRATVVPANCTREQFAAFLLVARDYNLNPITREIFAFPGRAGGIQPIVSVDGWARIINDQPQMDGLEFKDVIEGNKLVAITCRIWRKDRSKPIEVTEYLAECRRDTETWKHWPARMLRHKALIQCARYAFGLSGIVEPDEMERMMDDGTVLRRGSPSRVKKPPRLNQTAMLDRFANGEEENTLEEPEAAGEPAAAQETAIEEIPGEDPEAPRLETWNT